MVKRRVIIDTDCGGDDAVGIMCALTHPDTEVLAITTVWGNVNVDQGMDNIGKLLDLFKMDIPFYRGAPDPLMGVRETVQWGGFGADGFGDANFPQSARTRSQSKKHAALALVEILSNLDVMADVVYQLICLGPLTNIALALRLDPTILDHLGNKDFPGLVIMGGAIEAKGNSNMTAEFNIHCDPEAARIVFLHKQRFPLYLVSWELTVACAMPWKFFDKWLNRIRSSDGKQISINQSRIQTFLEKLFSRLEVFTRPQEDSTKADTGEAEATQDVTCVIPDAVAVAIALEPSLMIQDSFDTYVTVELQGSETRGETCIDWYGTDASMAKKNRWRNTKVITKCDQERYLILMSQIIGANGL